MNDFIERELKVGDIVAFSSSGSAALRHGIVRYFEGRFVHLIEEGVSNNVRRHSSSVVRVRRGRASNADSALKRFKNNDIDALLERAAKLTRHFDEKL